MTDEDAFRAAIRAAPDDDAPKLVFADWLDERERHKEAADLRREVDWRRGRVGLPVARYLGPDEG